MEPTGKKPIHEYWTVLRGKASELQPGDEVIMASLDEHEDIVNWWVESVDQMAMIMLLRIRSQGGFEERSAWVRADIIVEVERDERD